MVLGVDMPSPPPMLGGPPLAPPDDDDKASLDLSGSADGANGRVFRKPPLLRSPGGGRAGALGRGLAVVIGAANSNPLATGSGVCHGRRMSTGSMSEGLKQFETAFKTKFLRSPSSHVMEQQRPMAMDITGLRRAMLIRIWGMDMGPGMGFHRKPVPDTSSRLAGFLRRRASWGDDTHAVLVVWVLDLESGVEWKVRKTLADFMALREECQVLSPALVADFPLRRSRGGTEGGMLSKEKLDRLEAFLRSLAVLLDLSPSAATYQVAKLVQDFVGATERADILTEMQHRSDRDVQHMVQVYGCDLLRRDRAMQKRLGDCMSRLDGCHVGKTDVLGEFNRFVGRAAQDLLLEHGDVLRAIVTAQQGGGSGGSSSPTSEDDVDMLIKSCLRRVVEAELFVPLMPRLYERLALVTEQDKEEALAAKISTLSRRPQTFFGIGLESMSVSSWESAVGLLRRIGDTTTLPSDKLDVLVAAVKETHALFAREHPRARALAGDDFLPIFMYIVAQAGVPNLWALKTLLSELCDPQRLLGEAGYCLTTLEAACNYLVEVDEFAADP